MFSEQVRWSIGNIKIWLESIILLIAFELFNNKNFSVATIIYNYSVRFIKNGM